MVAVAQKDILIIGAGGLLGRALVQHFAPRWSVAGLTHQDLDITKSDDVLRVCQAFRPKVIILTAAYTNVDGCEENPSLAFAVNASGVKFVAEAARDVNAAVVSVSTDYVFNGQATHPYKEADAPDPISIYGQSKWTGERFLAEVLPRHVIVRSTWLFGETDKGFVPYVLKCIRENKRAGLVADKWSSPTSVSDLAEALEKIVDFILKGTYNFEVHSLLHITNLGGCSWFDIGEFVSDFLKTGQGLFFKVSLKDFPFKAKRPPYSVLDNSQYQRLTGQMLRPWQEALGGFLSCRKF